MNLENNLIKESYFPVNSHYGYSMESLQNDLEDINRIISKAKRQNVLIHLKEIKNKIENLISSKEKHMQQEIQNNEKLDKKCNEINTKIDNNTSEEDFKNCNEYEMLDLKNSILLDKYILDVTKSKVNVYFEIDNLKENNLENIYLNIDENGCLFLIVRKINGKNYHLLIKKLSHEVKDYKISIKDNKLKISLTKKDDNDTWDKLEDNKDKIFQPGPNETLISVSKLKYLYETGTEDEKKRIREKFGENIEERLKSLN